MIEENQLSEKIIGCAIEVHREIGPGLLENVYEERLCHELSRAGLKIRPTRTRSHPIQRHPPRILLATPLRLYLWLEGKVIVDAKAKAETTPIDKQQLLTYLRPCKVSLGLLINFNQLRLVDGITRIANNLPNDK